MINHNKLFESFSRHYENRQQENHAASRDFGLELAKNPGLGLAETAPWNRPSEPPAWRGRYIFPSEFKPSGFEYVSTEPPAGIADALRAMQEEVDARQREERSVAHQAYKNAVEQGYKQHSQDKRLQLFSIAYQEREQALQAIKEAGRLIDTSSIRARARSAAQEAIAAVWTEALNAYTNGKGTDR